MKSKRTIKRSIWVLVGMLLLAGCTNEITQPGARSDGKARISFDSPGIEEEVTTRVALAEKTTVRVVACVGTTYKADQTYYMNGGKLTPCTVNDNGSFKAVDTENELALLPDTYNFYAITPALPLSADKKSVTVPNGVDYASSLTPDIAVSTDKTLTLTQLARKCSKIALVVKKADDNTAMTALSVASGGVTISALPASQSVTHNADIAPAAGTATLNVPATAFTLTGTTSTAITYLLPRLGTERMKIDYNLTYTVSGTPETKPVSGTMGNIVLEKGKSYTFTLTMRKTGASLSVTDWIESNQEVVTGESLDYTDNGKPWFLTAAGDAVNPVDASETMNWFVATGIYDAALNPNTLKACPDGWKLPTLAEQLIMTAYMRSTPNLIFKSEKYWVSTITNPKKYWLVTYQKMLSYDDVGTLTNNVRCVRESSMTGNLYPYVIDGKIIVSRDENGGVRSAAIHPNWGDSSLMPEHSDQSTDNAVSAKFEVSANVSATGVTALAASTACAAGWRLPTQREMMLIWSTLTTGKLTVFAKPTANIFHWSGTGGNIGDGKRRYMDFYNGNTGSHEVDKKYYVRCVRDVQ